jgi:hypothetical protein
MYMDIVYFMINKNQTTMQNYTTKAYLNLTWISMLQTLNPEKQEAYWGMAPTFSRVETSNS